MNNESITKTFTVAALLAIVCAVIVSLADVSLKDAQRRNQALDRQTNILRAAGLVEPTQKITVAQADELFKKSATVVVDLETGEIVPDADPEAVESDKTNLRALDKDADIAGIGSIPKYGVVYLFYDDDGTLDALTLPIVGTGLWSTLYGFISLHSDCATVKRLVFYDHGETPGLGGEISNPTWDRKWEGKVAVDKEGEPIIAVVKGTVNPDAKGAASMVDGISGATLTGKGVTNTIRFWLGDDGYGPFLKKIRFGEIELPTPATTASSSETSATAN